QVGGSGRKSRGNGVASSQVVRGPAVALRLRSALSSRHHALRQVRQGAVIVSERLPLAPLCRFAGQTCAACCWGAEVPYPSLRARLRRQGRVFARWFPDRSRLGRLTLLLYELRVHGIADLFWGVLLLLPGVGDVVRPWLSRHLICAFLGYEDEQGHRVGC